MALVRETACAPQMRLETRAPIRRVLSGSRKQMIIATSADSKTKNFELRTFGVKRLQLIGRPPLLRQDLVIRPGAIAPKVFRRRMRNRVSRFSQLEQFEAIPVRMAWSRRHRALAPTTSLDLRHRGTAVIWKKQCCSDANNLFRFASTVGLERV